MELNEGMTIDSFIIGKVYVFTLIRTRQRIIVIGITTLYQKRVCNAEKCWNSVTSDPRGMTGADILPCSSKLASQHCSIQICIRVFVMAVLNREV